MAAVVSQDIPGNLREFENRTCFFGPRIPDSVLYLRRELANMSLGYLTCLKSSKVAQSSHSLPRAHVFEQTNISTQHVDCLLKRQPWTSKSLAAQDMNSNSILLAIAITTPASRFAEMARYFTSRFRQLTLSIPLPQKRSTYHI